MDCRVQVVVGLLEGDIAFDPASDNPTLVPLRRPAEPRCRTVVPRPHVEVVANPDNPDGCVPAQAAVWR
jgi:hypothetical protein